MIRDKDTRQPSERDGKTAGLTPSVAKLRRIIGPSPGCRMLTPYEIELLRESKREIDEGVGEILAARRDGKDDT